ncbi:MAG: hypothetical protein ABI689_00180 [Thermoanaerobaculia bacterium]
MPGTPSLPPGRTQRLRSQEQAAPGCDGFHTARDLRNAGRFRFWMILAAVAYVASTAALRWRESIPEISPAVQWILVGAALLCAVAALHRYLLFLRAADELLRRIQLEALGLGFAAGVVVAVLYPLAEGLGAPPVGERAIAVVMLLAWAAGSWLATRRFSDGA